jgi:hypothetical protein
VSPEEERSLADIERQIGRRLPRVTYRTSIMPPHQSARPINMNGSPMVGHRNHGGRYLIRRGKAFGHPASPFKGFGKPGRRKRSGSKNVT